MYNGDPEPILGPKDEEQPASDSPHLTKPKAVVDAAPKVPGVTPEPVQLGSQEGRQDAPTYTYSYSLIAELFDRYDIDGSETINSQRELRQLVTNLAYQLGISRDQASTMVKKSNHVKWRDEYGKEIEWDLQQVIEWLSLLGMQVDMDS